MIVRPCAVSLLNRRTWRVALARKITISRITRFSRIQPIGWSGGRVTVVRYTAISTASVPVLAWAAHHHPGRRRTDGNSSAALGVVSNDGTGSALYASQCRRV